MKNKMKINLNNLLIAPFILVTFLLVSCGESVDPGLSDIKLEMKATTQSGTINTGARAAAATEVEFTAVLIGVTEIEFEKLEQSNSDEDDCCGDHDDDNSDNHSDNNGDDYDHDDEIEFEGQFVVDLLEGTSTPDFGIADVIPGVYKELEVKISPIMDDGNSVFIRLNYYSGGMDTVVVEISTNKEMKFEIENESGIQLEENALNQILILFDLDKLFAGVDLSTATKDTDGVIRINGSSNTQIANTMWKNLNRAFMAGEDHDGDHEIDDDYDDHNDNDKDDHHSDDDDD